MDAMSSPLIVDLGKASVHPYRLNMGDSKGVDPERGRCWGPRRWCIGMRPACGHPRVAVRNVRNLIVAPVREHSRKPDDAVD
jgi:hypothetical protein